MSEPMSKQETTNSITKQDILEFLKENPDFLQENLEEVIPPKKRGSRGKPADFQAYVIDRLKSDKEEIIESTREIVENARSNMNNQVRIQRAILRLLEAQSFNDFIQTITMDLASLLDVDIAVLLVEAEESGIQHIQTNGIRLLPQGTIEGWMGDAPVLLQDNIGGIEAIYGGGANLVKSQILLRIDVMEGTPPALLAFGSREPDTFNETQATDQILFLTRVVERALRIWLKT